VRVDDRQFTRVHRALADVAVSLDVRDVPELYVLADPVPHAHAIGIDTPFVVLTSGMVDLLDDDDELRFVVGHELGHVLSGHALYTTVLLQLLRLSNTLSWVPLGALGLRAVIAALFEWQRKAELSGDRPAGRAEPRRRPARPHEAGRRRASRRPRHHRLQPAR
jgi:Zn-dependent protease with chaperone function